MGESVPDPADRAPRFSEAQQRLIDHASAAPRTTASRLLRQLATAFWRAGQKAEFAECVRRAYRLEPTFEVAGLRHDQTSVVELRDLMRTLVDHDVCYAPVIGNLAVTEAALGGVEAVRRLIDCDRFLYRGACGAPPGMTEAAFHGALATEIKANLEYFETRNGKAIRKAWRHDRVLSTPTPALQALNGLLRRQIADYIATLPGADDHPFLASRPSSLCMSSWAVVSRRDSHHVSHIHPDAWATGVFYVEQPEASRRSGDHVGWLRIGPPDGGPFLGPNAAPLAGWETRWIEPTPGSLVLMPGYFFHETQPMAVDQERICVAFEVQFPELERSDTDLA
jgi:hypothetical protein